MIDLDQAFETANKIAAEALTNRDKILTEEDAKLQIITRFLTEILGWSFSDIGAETKHDNGFSDYLLSNENRPALIVEAKRAGSLEIGSAEKNHVRYLKLSGPGLKASSDGIDQAAKYAMPNGIPLATLTDGITWIVFKTFIPGENFKTKEAIVFPSLEAVLADFSIFHDLLSKGNYSKKLYNPIFDRLHQRRLLLTQPLTPAIPEHEIKLAQKSELAFDLDKVFANFFDRLTGDEDEDMLIECFVESRESRIADFSLEKMTASVLGNISPTDRDVDTELASLIEAEVETETDQGDSGQTVFIVGPTGAGKSTFLERFFRKTLSSSLRSRCLVTRVNCLDSTGREDTALGWLSETLIAQFESIIYDGGSPSWDDLLGLYHTEYKRRSTGVDAHLYQRDKQAFREKFGEYLDQKVEEDREGYLKRILTDAVYSRKLLPIMVIDNTDEFSMEFKKSVFQFGQSLRRHAKHCLLIFPITDKSAWSFSKTDIFGIYQSRSFFLPTPSPREVLRKRIDFLNDKLADQKIGKDRGRYFSSRGIKISIENLSGFAKAIENVFVDHDYTSRTIGEITNYNIRRTLALAQRIITSSTFDIDQVLKSFATGQPISTKPLTFMNALLKGDYELFRIGDAHEVFPLFQVHHEIRQSPLMNLRILALLEATQRAAKTVEERHLSVQSVFNYFDAIGCVESAVDQALISLLEAGLIEPFDASIRDLSAVQRLAISFRGTAHLRLALHNSVFFEQMALTTSIVDADVAAQIRGDYFSKSDYLSRMHGVRKKFLAYLLSEDRDQVSADSDMEQYLCQHQLIAQLEKFDRAETFAEARASDPLGLIIDSAAPIEGVLATVDWFDPNKGFGFVDVDGLEGQVFLHAQRLAESGIKNVSDGDDILCDVDRNEKGLHVVKVHYIETDPEKVEVVDCRIIRIFPDREYGFVRVSDGPRDAFFHFSLFDEAERSKLAVGLSLKAEVISDKKGRGFQVKSVVKLETVD